MHLANVYTTDSSAFLYPYDKNANKIAKSEIVEKLEITNREIYMVIIIVWLNILLLSKYQAVYFLIANVRSN